MQTGCWQLGTRLGVQRFWASAFTLLGALLSYAGSRSTPSTNASAACWAGYLLMLSGLGVLALEPQRVLVVNERSGVLKVVFQTRLWSREHFYKLRELRDVETDRSVHRRGLVSIYLYALKATDQRSGKEVLLSTYDSDRARIDEARLQLQRAVSSALRP